MGKDGEALIRWKPLEPAGDFPTNFPIEADPCSVRHPDLRDTARAMSQENVEIVRKGVDAWNQHDAGLWLSDAAPDVEWMPAGPAAVERTVYRGHDEVASGFAAIWQTWDLFQLEEAQIRDLGDSVLWLGRAKMRGSTSQIPLDQEFASHTRLRDGQVITVRSFLAWREALEAVGLSEQDAHADC